MSELCNAIGPVHPAGLARTPTRVPALDEPEDRKRGARSVQVLKPEAPVDGDLLDEWTRSGGLVTGGTDGTSSTSLVEWGEVAECCLVPAGRAQVRRAEWTEAAGEAQSVRRHRGH